MFEYLEGLPLRKKIIFIILSIFWTSLVVFLTYIGDKWSEEQYWKSPYHEDGSPEAYYP